MYQPIHGHRTAHCPNEVSAGHLPGLPSLVTTLGGCVAAPQQSMVGFEDIVGQIYEAATEPDLWASVLHEIGRSALSEVRCWSLARTGG